MDFVSLALALPAKQFKQRVESVVIGFGKPLLHGLWLTAPLRSRIGYIHRGICAIQPLRLAIRKVLESRIGMELPVVSCCKGGGCHSVPMARWQRLRCRAVSWLRVAILGL